jgi:hypothetical protein
LMGLVLQRGSVECVSDLVQRRKVRQKTEKIVTGLERKFLF